MFWWNKPRVSVTFAKPQYEPGELVQAQVRLSLQKPISGAVLTATLQCRETVRFRNNEAVTCRGEHIISEAKIALTRVNTSFVPGEYEYSAQWILPVTLPWHGVNNVDVGEFTIESGVRVKLQRAEKRRPDMEAFYVVPVHTPASTKISDRPRSRGKPVAESSTIQLKARRGVAPGTCKLTARLDTDVLGSSSLHICHVTVHNTSGRDVQCLTAQLLQERAVLTQGDCIRCTYIMASWDYSSLVLEAVPTTSDERSVSLSFNATDFVKNHTLMAESCFIRFVHKLSITCQLSDGASVTVKLPVRIPRS